VEEIGQCDIHSNALADQELVAKLAEMDFVVADLERANSRVSTVERRNVGVRSISVLPSSPQYY